MFIGLHVWLSAACDALLALVALCETTEGLVLALQESGSGHSDQVEAIVPAFARALPRLASSDDGSERTSRGRDNLESWSFPFKAPIVVGTCIIDLFLHS